MAYLLHYGRTCSLTIDDSGASPPVICDAPRGCPVASVAEAVDEALAAPIGYPPLAQSLVPGDSVALALEPGVPQAPRVVQAVTAYLVRAGVSADAITVLQTQQEARARLSENEPLLLAPSAVGVQMATHDPADRSQLSFLAATRRGRPVYLNRVLCEADVVVPIGCFHGQRHREFHGLHVGLYPTFSDDETQTRFRDPRLVDPQPDIRQRAQREVDSVDWLSGIRFNVQVIPGAGDDILHILAGDIDQVVPAAAQQWQVAWEYEMPERTELVVAAVSGTTSYECWEQIAQSLEASQAVVADNGKIALCTDFAGEPGPALKLLADRNDRDLALREIRKLRLPDAPAALALDRAQQQARVYWLSRLDEEFVSELGVTPVSDPADIERLARRHNSCTVLAHAQRIVLVPR